MKAVLTLPLRGLVCLFAGLLLGGCTTMLKPPYTPGESGSARASFDFCEQGASCTLTPMAMVLIDKVDPNRSYDFRSWMLYDTRDFPLGQRYVALMNESNDPICRGFYSWYGLNMSVPVAMTCFESTERGTGDFHFSGLQTHGPFKGKRNGAGVINLPSAKIYFVFGATPDETKTTAFDQLWNKYGGDYRQYLSANEVAAKRVTSVKRMDQARR